MTYTLGEIGLAIKRLQVRHHRALDAALTPLGLSVAQWDTLRHLQQNPDASLHELALLTFQSDQSIGTLATRMVTRGLIERVDAPGRAVRHRITQHGRRLLTEAQCHADATVASSLGMLSEEELAAFGATLRRLLGADMPGGRE